MRTGTDRMVSLHGVSLALSGRSLETRRDTGELWP